MKDAEVLVGTYTAALLLFLFLSKGATVPLDYHHLFAYLTAVGFIALTSTGAIIKGYNMKRGLHLYFGIATAVSLILTIYTYRYAILY
jgi:branched-subunit amino acid transport protein